MGIKSSLAAAPLSSICALAPAPLASGSPKKLCSLLQNKGALERERNTFEHTAADGA